MRILAPKDGGKIQLLRLNGETARLAIRADERNAEFRQFFSFVARDLDGRCDFEIANAADCTYGDAFEGYRVCASTREDDDWFRVPTELDDGTLRFSYTPKRGEEAVRFAYFPPYTRTRRRALGDRLRKSRRAIASVAGKTLGGEPMEVFTFGDDEDVPKIWIVGQQHPGETMAGWFMEGAASRLAFGDDPVAEELRERARIFLVLCMNPDGAFAGNHRTNGAGLDLNRCWWDADDAKSPEVVGVRTAMYDRGVDFFLDVHGDEHVPYVFVAGAEGNPHYTDRIEGLEDAFSSAMLEASDEFQTEEGYPKDAPGKGDLRCAGNYVGEAFDCLSLTLEMPFKDNANAPDDERGWSPDRCRTLGASTLEAVAKVLEDLR
ncbi:MAG TPA: M14-type cytosolic carboxypeptidase [Polyangiaceae bacterium]|jgi:murein tripeptide amidase MpaA